MKIIPKQKLNYHMIENTTQIQEWLEQFSESDRHTAISMLMSLDFISQNDYSAWLLNKLSKYQNTTKCAIYSVRKFKDNDANLWTEDGSVINRPAETLGSEDFVSSIIANAIRQDRQNGKHFYDHLPLNELREYRIHDIILIDDSIGSGNRISNFIKAMMNSKTFLSWWSSGFITLHIISVARTKESEGNILKNTPGSDHAKRKRKLSQKLLFNSEIVYSSKSLETRWGNNCDNVEMLCKTTTKIDTNVRLGYGKVMGNIVFYHSVPNNIPGIFFFEKPNKWKPLFPGRTLPEWCLDLLKASKYQQPAQINSYQIAIPDEILEILLLIKQGIICESSIASRMNYDERTINEDLTRLNNAGLISKPLHNFQLTDAGKSVVDQKTKKSNKSKYDFSLYIPNSWCAD